MLAGDERERTKSRAIQERQSTVLEEFLFTTLLSFPNVRALSKVTQLVGAMPGLEFNAEFSPPHQDNLLNKSQEVIPYHETP